MDLRTQCVRKSVARNMANDMRRQTPPTDQEKTLLLLIKVNFFNILPQSYHRDNSFIWLSRGSTFNCLGPKGNCSRDIIPNSIFGMSIIGHLGHARPRRHLSQGEFPGVKYVQSNLNRGSTCRADPEVEGSSDNALDNEKPWNN